MHMFFSTYSQNSVSNALLIMLTKHNQNVQYTKDPSHLHFCYLLRGIARGHQESGCPGCQCHSQEVGKMSIELKKMFFFYKITNIILLKKTVRRFINEFMTIHFWEIALVVRPSNLFVVIYVFYYFYRNFPDLILWWCWMF